MNIRDEVIEEFDANNLKEDTVNSYKSVTDRYFESRYKLDVNGKGNDHCILFQANGLCIVTLAPSHPIISQQKAVAKIEFTEAFSNNKVSGKRKRGGQYLNETSKLCKIDCEDGSSYFMYSCVKGKLLEVNTRIIDDPNLLIKKPDSEGYLAIILPKFGQSKPQQVALLDREQFLKVTSEEAILVHDPTDRVMFYYEEAKSF